MKEKEFISRNLIHGDNRNYYIPIVVSFLFIYLVPLFKDFDLSLEVGIIGATGWLLFHALRFRKKETLTRRDYLKLVLALFYGLSLLEFYLNNSFDGLVVVVSLFSVFAIYFIDRIILNNMKKLSIAFIILLMLVSVFFVVFANIQTRFAEELATDAVALVEAAEREAANARQAEAEAILLRQELQECQGNN